MKQNTKRLYSMVIALFFLVLALVWYFDFLVPAYTDLQTAKGNQISEQNLLTNEQQIVSQFQGLLASYQSQSSDEQAVDAALPVGPHLADAIAQIYGIASANNVAVQSMGIASELIPSPATGSGVSGAASTGQIVHPVGTITFTLGMIGSYENFKAFLGALETNIRLFDVKQVTFQPGGVTGKGSVPDVFNYSITATTYYQSP
jgi:hypothetical protein